MRVTKIIVISFTSLSVIAALWLAASLFRKTKELPYLGEPGHVAGDFSFINQQGKEITAADVQGKVTVVEYFFTSCPGICKVMNHNLQKVYAAYEQDSLFTILSHSVDPEKDSVPVLAAYAAGMQVKPENWQFLTGDKYLLYHTARTDYLLSVEEAGVATGSAEDFIHTQYVALLDKERRIRGFYDATDSTSIERLIDDIAQLQSR